MVLNQHKYRICFINICSSIIMSHSVSSVSLYLPGNIALKGDLLTAGLGQNHTNARSQLPAVRKENEPGNKISSSFFDRISIFRGYLMPKPSL